MVKRAQQSSPVKQLYRQLRQTYQATLQDSMEWLQVHAPSLEQVRQVSQQTLAAVSLAGSVVMNNPSPLATASTWAQPLMSTDQQVERHLEETLSQPQDAELALTISKEEKQAILDKLKDKVKLPAGHLEKQEELYLEQQLTDMLGFEVSAELESNRLNHSIGIMGGEQHLKRFPGDTLEQHDAYLESGIAPNRGAFGWFTEQGELTEQAKLREKYYFAVQTMYLPNWNTDHSHLKKWYRFRKMIVINPAEETAVVGVVGDAGPAQWVKKQFGGSPEVIREGKIWSKQSRGRVLLLFVNDPEDKVPLGPIDLKVI